MSTHLAALLDARAAANPSGAALRSRKAGRWVAESWSEWAEASRAVAAGLLAAGRAKGDRVLIMASTRAEWAIVDFGILGAGLVTVPVYPNASAEELAAIVENSGARTAFIESASGLLALIAALGAGADFDDVIVFDASVPLAPIHRDGKPDVPVRHYTEFLREALAHASDASALEARQREIAPSDVATIVYTSGTTGAPRGAVLTHQSLLHEVRAIGQALPIGSDDEQLLFLPLAHIFARVVLFAAVHVGMRTAFSEGMQRVVENFAEVKPSVFASVPRLFEKVFAVANEAAAAEGAVKERIWRWAVGIGLAASRARQRGEHPSGLLAARLRYADKIALGKVRARFGGRLRFAVSGGAPLSKELAEWFHAMGILVLEGYGLTEMCGSTHVNRLDAFRFGSVGKPLDGVEVMLGKDQEVLMRGPTLMQGFFGQPEATHAVIDENGWFHTGDVGRLDADGFLSIVDRKKDLIVTAGGSNVAPANLERMLQSSPWIGRAVVLGDRERFLIALITLDMGNVKRWAIENRRGTDPAALAQDPELLALIQLDVDDVNRRLSRFEQIRKFAILERDLSVAAGELTETEKPRRDKIRQRHESLIHAMYDASAPFHPKPE